MKSKLTWSAIKADFDMNSVTSVYFWKSEWERFDPHDHSAPVSIYYYLYRFLYMSWFIGSFIQNFICNPPDGYYFLFLTNLTFALQLIYSVLSFLYVTFHILRGRESINNNEAYYFHQQEYKLPIPCKVIWILHSVLVNIPYVVTDIYWMFLFGEQTDHETTCRVMYNLLVHGLNSPLALLESFVVAVPIRRTHMIFPMIAGVCYSTFTGLYEVLNGEYGPGKEYIYPMLNWKNKPALAVGTSLGVIFVVCPILHFVMGWGIYRLRIFLRAKFCTKCERVSEQGHYNQRGDEHKGRGSDNKIYF